MSVPAHGGELINGLASAARAKELRAEAPGLQAIQLSEREQCDVEMIGSGAFSPLTGFMGEKDFHAVCEHMRLADGTVWPVPITCSVNSDKAAGIDLGARVALQDETAQTIAVLTVQEKYAHDKQKEAKQVYRTDDSAHPGVAVVMQQGDVCLGGPLEVLPHAEDRPFAAFRLAPAETREAFAERGWNTIVAFQTRNPIHRAHEYLTKCSLEVCDGLMIHPLIGQTQAGDIPAEVRMKCYQVLIEKYYQPQRTLLAVMPSAMRYAGPREAVLHAIVRQNYGCSHFIVGRDHAGVGDYYGTYDAQKIFDTIEPHELMIRPLKFEHASWCNPCEGMVSSKTCPHGPEDKVFLSGTKVREMLKAGEVPPMEFTRPEVAQILMAEMKNQ